MSFQKAANQRLYYFLIRIKKIMDKINNIHSAVQYVNNFVSPSLFDSNIYFSELFKSTKLSDFANTRISALSLPSGLYLPRSREVSNHDLLENEEESSSNKIVSPQLSPLILEGDLSSTVSLWIIKIISFPQKLLQNTY